MADAEAKAYRSGLLDSSFRFSVNLKGGPAMDQRDIVKWRQKTLLGVSIRVVAPTWAIRFSQTDKLWFQPLGLQAGNRPVAAQGALGGRHLRGVVVFHRQP